MSVSLGQLIKIIREPQMEVVVDRLIDFSAGKDDELRDISSLGMLKPLLRLIKTFDYLQPSRQSRLSCRPKARLRQRHARS